MSKNVLVTDYFWPSLKPEEEILSQVNGKLLVAPDGNENTLLGLSPRVDAMLVGLLPITEAVIRAAEKCVVISRYGIGVDNLAVDTATELGIAILNVPDYCIEEVADHTMGLLLAWNRRIVLFDHSTKSIGWGKQQLDMRIMRLRGMVLGIIGFGRIGRAVSKRALAFGMDVLVSDRSLTSDQANSCGVSLVDLSQLLQEASFVSLHTPLNPGTVAMIGREELAMMKSDAFLINTARGSLVDEDALYDALTSGGIAGAGIDVVVDLVPSIDHQLLLLGNVIATPHMAYFSQEATLELQKRAAQGIVQVIKGEMPNNLVNPEIIGKSRALLGVT